MPGKHLSSQFNLDLVNLLSYVMELGRLVTTQLTLIGTLLISSDNEVADNIIDLESNINALELEIDKSIVTMIARYQPIALDLRLAMAMSRVTTDLERVGDEANKIAKIIKSLPGEERIPICKNELLEMSRKATDIMLHALDSYDKLDVISALEVLQSDRVIDLDFHNIKQTLATVMAEQGQFIRVGLDLLLIAKACERIGDHAKNIAEVVIYIVKGDDIRHISLSDVDKLADSAKVSK